MSYGQGLAEAFGCMIGTIVICVICIVGFVCYLVFSRDEIVTKKPIVPEIRLVTDGKKVDTLYVYKIK